MKFTATLFGLFAAQALAVNMYSAPNAAAECGALGVAEWDLDTLPAGMDVSELRKCKEHPLSVKIHSRNPDSTKVNVLEKRKCTSSKWKPKAGCDKHWCWQNCGSAKEVEWGFWCWSAHKDGKGAWMSCSNDSDCPTDDKFCEVAISGASSVSDIPFTSGVPENTNTAAATGLSPSTSTEGAAQATATIALGALFGGAAFVMNF